MKLTIPELRTQLKYFRKKYKLSQQDIADAIGVSLLTIYRFENWLQDTSGEKIMKIFDFLEKEYPSEWLKLKIEYKKGKGIIR